MNLPSGPGQTTKDQSLSVTHASDDPMLAAETADDADIAASRVSLASVDTKLSSQATAAKQDLIETAVKRLAPLGPGGGSATPSASRIFGVAFTANAVVQADLTTANYAGLKTAIDAGKLLTVKSSTGCYYTWATSGAAITASSTAASNPALQAMPFFDGERSDERAPSGTTNLNILGGPVAGTFYVGIAE